ncbi:UNC93-like protein MFSD11 [Planococcus citri]|uniref:UNC93-like protein MFSD11 n=1 Tax=Planococcus citri TaxID=170843 RepID=UPI0031F787C7
MMFTVPSSRLMKDVYLGLCFMMIFASKSGLDNVTKTVTTSIEKDDPSCHLDGYIMAGIGYTALSAGMWFSPAIVAAIGPKFAMVLGTITFVFFLLTMLAEQSLWIYFSTALTGFGGSVLWTGQATYTVLNSEIGRVYRGIGVFWILYQSSHFLSNLIVYLIFNDVHRSIDRSMRLQLELILLCFNVVGVLMLFGLRPPLRSKHENAVRSPFSEILKSFKILFSPKMMILIVSMISMGLHFAFLHILCASMGFSKYLSANSKELAPLCGLLQGIGEVFGGVSSIVIGGKTVFNLRSQMTSAVLCNILSYIIVFLALPNTAPQTYTDDLPIMMLPIWVLVFGAFLSGFGDACLQTEMYNCLGTMYPNDSPSAFAAFKFIRFTATASGFYYSEYLGLYTQLIILITMNVISWILYHCAQWFSINTASKDEIQPDNVSDGRTIETK